MVLGGRGRFRATTQSTELLIARRVEMQSYQLTTAGWVFMAVSCVSMVVWTAWCYYRVLTAPQASEHMHAPLDIDTHDKDT